MEAETSLSLAELYARARAKVPTKVRLGSRAITRRNPLLVAVLSVATLGVYGLVWAYTVTRELRATTSHREMRPVRDVLLTALTLGLYGVVVVHRQARTIHAVSRYFDRSHRDRSWETLTFAIGGVLTFGLLGAWAAHVVQTQMNELADLADARERDRQRRAARVLTPASRPSLRDSSGEPVAKAPPSSSEALPSSGSLEIAAAAPAPRENGSTND